MHLAQKLESVSSKVTQVAVLKSNSIKQRHALLIAIFSDLTAEKIWVKYNVGMADRLITKPFVP